MCKKEPATKQALPVAPADSVETASSPILPSGPAPCHLYLLLLVCHGGLPHPPSLLSLCSWREQSGSSFPLTRPSSEDRHLIFGLCAGERMLPLAAPLCTMWMLPVLMVLKMPRTLQSALPQILTTA